MHIVDALAAEAWSDLDILLLHVEDEGKKAFNACCWYVVAVRALDEGLELGVEGVSGKG